MKLSLPRKRLVAIAEVHWFYRPRHAFLIPSRPNDRSLNFGLPLNYFQTRSKSRAQASA
jgi:hypothetical protein